MIYFDHNASSPLLPEVLEAMQPFLGAAGNAASAHRAGQRAAAAVERAREAVASLVGGHPAGVVFTSGATEANHTFLRGIVRRDPTRRRVVVSAIEHPCVAAAARVLASEGFLVDVWPVGADGVVRVETVPKDAAVVSLMAANHETGVVQDLDRAIEVANAVGAAVHVDATQAVGRIPLPSRSIDGVVLSGHKLGGPGGIGALVLRDGEPFPALLPGGAQERGRRGGTIPVAAAVGFGEACRLAAERMAARAVHLAALSERLRGGLVAAGGRLVGDPSRLLPNTTCVVFAGIRGETVVQALDINGVCVSAGAACASGSLEPSPVLLAMRDPEPSGGVRFSLGPGSTVDEVDRVLQLLPSVLAAARAFAFLSG